jgi:hypothetical protein
MDLINNSLTPVTSTSTLAPVKASPITQENKENFRALISLLTRALSLHDSVYPVLVDAATPFDRELARKIEASAKADRDLLTYLKSKTERGEALPPAIITGLLNR